MNRQFLRRLAIFVGVASILFSIGAVLAMTGVTRWEVVLIVLLAILIVSGEFIFPDIINR
jgi:hypothetical protein